MATLCIASIETREGEPCEEGKEYDAQAAEECNEAVKSQSCEDYNAGNTPESCSRVCVAK